MANKNGAKPETKTEFLRKALSRKPDLEYEQIRRRWMKTGHAGDISNALYYQVRAKLGIKSQWGWFPADAFIPGNPVSGADAGQVYQFKITLMDIEPPIWRRIQVTNGTLDQLHEHIQTAMGWTNSHLHQFRIDETLYGDPMLMAETFEELKYEDSTKTRLSDLFPAGGKGSRIEYEYDFGDGWVHEILFEGLMPAEPRKQYPLCLEGARACPPDDVGGVWGYADFLAAIADPDNEQHDEMREWIGRKFDPEAFNPTTATRRMKQGLPDWRKMR
jgi:Plasmid pRiA4b ORF-3-like protein